MNTSQKIKNSAPTLEELESELSELMKEGNPDAQKLLVEIALYLKRKKMEIQNAYDQYGQKMKPMAEILGIDKARVNEEGGGQLEFLREEARMNTKNEDVEKRKAAQDILNLLDEWDEYFKNEKEITKRDFGQLLEDVTSKV